MNSPFGQSVRLRFGQLSEHVIWSTENSANQSLMAMTYTMTVYKILKCRTKSPTLVTCCIRLIQNK